MEKCMRDTWFTALPHDNLEDIHIIRKLFVSVFEISSHLNPTPTYPWRYSRLKAARNC